MRGAAFAVTGICALSPLGCRQEAFSAAEIQQVQQYWSAPGRYEATPAPAFVVRLTPAGSQWLWEYNKKRGLGKTPPGQVPSAATEQERVWEAWIDERVANDRAIAASLATTKTEELKGNSPSIKVVPPGQPIPDSLMQLMGTPPFFAEAVRPVVHKIKFDDAQFEFEDNVEMKPRYAYYRFKEGVRSFGTKVKTLPASELNGLFSAAGITPSQARVFKAVSLLEGGFDSINTYDTGFVSVGFIQFASLAAGGHSLGQSLLQLKRDDPRSFQEDFRKFGIDVTETGTLIAVDLTDGKLLQGPDANAQIIKDKRLIAVFARAGGRKPYRIAQLKTAKAMYWPVDAEISVPGTKLKGRLSEIIRSEAGQAVFMDRKVNTGNLGPLADALASIASQASISRFSDFAAYEALLIRCLYYRFDPGKDPTLTQPGPCPMLPSVLARFGRG